MKYEIAVWIVCLSSCSEQLEADPYFWFQGEWISDPGVTMASNLQFDLLDPDVYVEVRNMYGKARWSVQKNNLVYSELNSDIVTDAEFTTEGIDEESFRYRDSWGGRLIIKRQRSGFCMFTETLLELENIIECFKPFSLAATPSL